MIEGEGGLLDRPLREVSIEELSQLFLGASKTPDQWMVGAEIEVFSFHRKTLKPGIHAELREVIKDLGARLDMAHQYEVNGELIGLHGGGQAVSLEPGGQFEFASSPHRSLKALRTQMTSFADVLRELGNQHGLGFWAMGHQPFVDRDTAPVMPKPRYDIMRAYLPQHGARALDMMHLTGSVQCTVDFLDNKNLADKVRTAVKVSPYLSALVAASPLTNGKPNGFHSLRYQIWLETDDARCGIWPEMVDEKGLTAERYVERTLNTPVMFFMREGGFKAVEPKTLANYAKEGFEGSEVTVSDYLDHLTTFFPEVRPKGYVELRGADCMRVPEAVAIAGFWRAVLDNEEVRQEIDSRLSAMDYAAIRTLQPLVATQGLGADSASGPVKELIHWIMKTAYQGMKAGAPDCAECLEPLLERAENGRSPSMEILERWEKMGPEEALSIIEL